MGCVDVLSTGVSDASSTAAAGGASAGGFGLQEVKEARMSVPKSNASSTAEILC
jgi:hypothetical protein